MNSNSFQVQDILDELKYRIKTMYKSQERFAKDYLFQSREWLNKRLNGNNPIDFDDLIKICRLCHIESITIPD